MCDSECKLSDHSYPFKIKENIDFKLSSADNYADDSASFVGKYGELRKALDYNYHRRFSVDRQVLHDLIIDRFTDTIIFDGDMVCDTPLYNWIVFTAGPMGAGKSHILRWLAKNDYFPLAAFVRVDPDALRACLPETPGYFLDDPDMAGILTQKEVGYISEVLTLWALRNGRNVIVDGSLRDANWYSSYLKGLRQQFPTLRIAIMQVMASEKTILSRAKSRAVITGRVVPEWLLLQYIREVPQAVAQLIPAADYVCTLWNDYPQQKYEMLNEQPERNAGETNPYQQDQGRTQAYNSVRAVSNVEDDCCEEEQSVSDPTETQHIFTISGNQERFEPQLVYSSANTLSWDDFRSIWVMRCRLSEKLGDRWYHRKSLESLLKAAQEDAEKGSSSAGGSDGCVAEEVLKRARLDSWSSQPDLDQRHHPGDGVPPAVLMHSPSARGDANPSSATVEYHNQKAYSEADLIELKNRELSRPRLNATLAES